jgi:hypothetical protein
LPDNFVEGARPHPYGKRRSGAYRLRPRSRRSPPLLDGQVEEAVGHPPRLATAAHSAHHHSATTGGNAGDVARRNDPDRAAVVAGTHRTMQRLLGLD